MVRCAKRGISIAACVVAIVAAGAVSDVFGGKPTPPPPPPPNPFLIYEWRPELGGWLDKETKLVWGYDLLAHAKPVTQPGAVEAAANYADILYDFAVGLPATAAWMESEADRLRAGGDLALAAGDPELAQAWYDNAAAHDAEAQRIFDSIPPAEAAADVAAQFTWRLPTKAEAERALFNGLFTYGSGGFDSYDCSPQLGLQPADNYWEWTSTLSKSKREAYVYTPGSGYPESGIIGTHGINSTMDAIFVRTYVP